jgi:proteasome assembly chaperone (PAC2) family protein
MQTLVGAAISFGAGIALLIFAKRLAANKLTIERSDFLNALLSSALGAKHKFCIIVTQSDGQIVYLNSGFQAAFPKMLEVPKRTLTKFYSTYGISADKAKSITTAVKKATSKEVSVEVMNDKSKKTQKMKFIIEPIARPSGFILIRGA